MSTSSLVWLAEAKKAPGWFLYINECGKPDYTPVAKLSLRLRTESGCLAYIEEFGMALHFKPTAHIFE